MKDAVKERLEERGITALIAAVLLGVGILIGQAGFAVDVADMLTDEELRAEICGEETLDS